MRGGSEARDRGPRRRSRYYVEHPDGAIYIFRGTITRLTRGDLAEADLFDVVYITAGDLYPAQAGAIVFADRYAKAVS